MFHHTERTTGDSHLDVPSCGAYHRRLAPRCSIMRSVPPATRTYMFHHAERTTGDSHLHVPSCGAYHRRLAPTCSIMRSVPPMARN
ncbi:hypothetical protein AVEN_206208-1 [Araneus ventricosus]|uniref:Uncharacterized protein n=1 Tax=Araneus ventricosus TaxID=182803 RepID=A0A4Y2WK67_ARAVE|nr:hypothetical protein AVEN_206208-1 [Araneus ventricosus]